MTSLFYVFLRTGENPDEQWDAIDYKKNVNFKDVHMLKNMYLKNRGYLVFVALKV